MEASNRQTVLFLWRRFGARFVDFLLCLSLCYALAEGLFLDPARHSLAWFLLVQTAAAALMAALEPLLVTRWGRTPGKALFGLKLTSSQGERLTPAQARARPWQLWRAALGYGLPFYRLVTLIRAYAAGKRGTVFIWEEGSILV